MRAIRHHTDKWLSQGQGKSSRRAEIGFRDKSVQQIHAGVDR